MLGILRSIRLGVIGVMRAINRSFYMLAEFMVERDSALRL